MGMEALIPAVMSFASSAPSFAAPIMSAAGSIGSSLLGGLSGGAGAAGSGILGTLGNLTGAGQIAPMVGLPDLGKMTWDIASPAAEAAASGIPTLSPANAYSTMTMPSNQSISPMQRLGVYAGQRLIDSATTPRQGGNVSMPSLPSGGDMMMAPPLALGNGTSLYPMRYGR